MKTLLSLFLTVSIFAGNLSTLIGASGGGGGPTFAGYTTATYDGASVGGIVGLNAKCQLEYSGSHMCFLSDYMKSGVSTAPATSTWILSNSANVSGIGGTGGNFVSHGCSGWNSNSNTYYAAAIEATSGRYRIISCDNSLSLACCKF